MDTPSQDKSALNVMNGVEQPGQINEEMVRKMKVRRSGSHDVQWYVDGILEGNRTILSQSITLIESALPKHQEKAQEIIAECLGKKNDEFRISNNECRTESIRVGITGVPGAGKSTFIEALGKYLTSKGHRLAVLAIDPSSSRSKGSILGDKTRMEELAVDPNAFIRPSPSAGSLGGVARKTRETILLCEVAGFDVIFVETVGVGQSETAVHSMVDFFLLLMLAGAGDELQGIKRGIIEMADAIFVNKADADNMNRARVAQNQLSQALHYFPPAPSGWLPPVALCSALSGQGIPEAWDVILDHHEKMAANGFYQSNRIDQNLKVLYETVEKELMAGFYKQKGISGQIRQAEEEIRKGKANPYEISARLMESYFGSQFDSAQ